MALRMLGSRLGGLLQPARERLATDLPRLVVAPRAFSSAAQPAEQPAGEAATAKQGWGQTTIMDILKAKVPHDGAWLWCSKDDMVIDAVRKMTKGNVGSLLVFDPSKLRLESGEGSDLRSASSEAVVGIVTERDYLTKVVVSGKSSKELKVSEIMTREEVLKTVSPSDTVLAAMELMIDFNFRHVPVVDNGSYLGMISIRDAVRTMVVEHREEVDKLHEYIQGSY
jgi:CBS domain-containing protein